MARHSHSPDGTVAGEACAVPNDDTLAGKADEKVPEYLSPQEGREGRYPLGKVGTECPGVSTSSRE